MPGSARSARSAQDVNTEDLYDALRERMLADVEAQTERLGMGALSDRVMAAIARVPRHEFVSEEIRPFAYIDQPLPIGFGTTISQPFIVALMTHLLEIEPRHRVLEVGTGCGYQAAVLAELAREVYTVETVPELAAQSASRLARLAYGNIAVRMGNGRLGWPDHAPFDRIIVTAASELIPPALLQQLEPGGRIVIPTGIPGKQQLLLAQRTSSAGLCTREVVPVSFGELEEDAGPVGTC
jgi:protein-L-isoaspartate(D-aspartate) O-methyltransferase